MGTMKWQPNWWNENHSSSWDRVREAVRRDWVQTKKDLGLGRTGHELNQGISDTVKQATGKEAIPVIDRANPPKVIGDWDDAEGAVGYGYAAREHYGAEHPAWTTQLEDRLKAEWDDGRKASGRAWDEVKSHVRHGYEHDTHHD